MAFSPIQYDHSSFPVPSVSSLSKHAERETDDITYQLQSINFHHQGIGLFGPERLPTTGNYAISFSYQDEDSTLQIEQLARILIYSNETEVGNQYGVRFNLDHIDQEALSKLLDIEKRLKNSEDSNGRYGLFVVIQT